MKEQDPAEECGPPWIVHAVNGSPYEILAAGRPGCVANVRGISKRKVQRIVDCANATEAGIFARIEALTDRVVEMNKTVIRTEAEEKFIAAALNFVEKTGLVSGPLAMTAKAVREERALNETANESQ